MESGKRFQWNPVLCNWRLARRVSHWTDTVPENRGDGGMQACLLSLAPGLAASSGRCVHRYAVASTAEVRVPRLTN